MCQQCKELDKKVAQSHEVGGCSNDQELNSYILEIFEATSRFLETSSKKGNVRQNLDQATENLMKMYEFDAPECLIRKAHAVHRNRLRDSRALMRSELDANEIHSQRRRRFILVQGGRS